MALILERVDAFEGTALPLPASCFPASSNAMLNQIARVHSVCTKEDQSLVDTGVELGRERARQSDEAEEKRGVATGLRRVGLAL